MMKKKRPVVVSFPESRGFAETLAHKSGKPHSCLRLEKFPDRETHLLFRTDVEGRKVFLVRSLDDPDKKLIEVLFAAHTAKELGAKQVVLVAPYLCYMRQDKRFMEGEAVSSRIIAGLFNECLDGLITVDPHLHRYKNLNDIFTMKTKRLTAVKPIAEFLKRKVKKPFVFGPDEESYQWASKVAGIMGCEADVLRKRRYSSETVMIDIKEKYDLKKRGVIIVDDVISTGHTMIEVIKDVKKLGARKIYCVCTHGIFAQDSLKKIKKLGAVVYTTNTVKNNASKVDITGLLAKEIR